MKNPENKEKTEDSSVTEKVRFLTVSEEEAGRRLDNYLMTLAPGVPRTRIYRAIRSGEVRINKGRSSAGYRLKDQDIVRIPPLRLVRRDKPQAGSEGQMAIVSSVMERHKAYYVINKPAGWAVHGGSGISLGVIETLRQASPGDRYLELVHRLDRATSGCLVVARKRSFLREMHRQVREGEVAKTYLMLVKGHWDLGRYRCELSLHTHKRKNGERHVQVSELGKYCRTDFKPVDFFSGATLLEAKLITGRTHQLRVHCSHLGHPIVGDQRYGDKETNKKMVRVGIKRLFLHASSIAFEYPQGNPVQFGAPLGDELTNALNKLDAKRGS